MIDALNAAAQIWYRYMTSAAVQATLLALMLLGIGWAVRRRSPALHHALLMIALLKFVIPPTLPLPTGLFSRIKPATSIQSAPAIHYVAPIVEDALWLSEEAPPPRINVPVSAAIAARSLSAPTSSMPSSERHPLTTKAWGMTVHLLGSLLILALAIHQRIRLRRLALGATIADDPDLLATYEELCAGMRLWRRPRLLLSSTSHAPMTFGAWKPVIVLSQSLVTALPQLEIRVILGHELAHQRRWDLWLGWLQVPISAVWWFNPVYWLLTRRIRSVREDCCDDLVVASGLATGEAYCETLLQAARVASGNALAGASLAYIGESQPLRRRFQRIMSAKFITKPKLAWAGILIVVVIGLLFLPGIRKRRLQNAHKVKAPQAEGGTPSQTVAVPETPLPWPPAAIEPVSRQVLFHVIDAATGRGIQGATLHFNPISGTSPPLPGGDPTTDKSGSCAVTAVPGNLVNVRANGYISRRLRFQRDESLPAEYTFKLGKGISIGGYVRDEKGKPIQDVQITVGAGYSYAQMIEDTGPETSNSSLLVQSDAAGRWICDELHPELDYVNLSLARPEYVPAEYSTRAVPTMSAPQVVSIDELKAAKTILTMKYGLLISGMVYDEKGKPVEGASLFHIEQLRRISSTLTGPDGRFRFTDGKPGDMALKVEANGFAPEIRAIQAVPRMPDLEFKLAKGQVVSGRVIDDEGNPIADAIIRAMPPSLGLEIGTWWEAKTDSQGRFLWNSAPLVPLNYMVSAAGFMPPTSSEAPSASARLSLEPGKEHLIKLQRLPEMHISGRVIDAATKMPIDKFKATAISSSAPSGGPVEGTNGEFTLALNGMSFLGEGPPKFNIVVEASGYRPDNSQTIEFKKGDWKIEIALVRGDGPSGVVKLPNGEPVSQARVFLCGGFTVNSNPGFSQEKVPIAPVIGGVKSVSAMGSRSFANTTTDEAGRFALAPVADPLTVIATHEKGFASVTVDQLSSSPTITLQPWGRIEGVIRIGTKPAGEQRVTLRSMFFGRTAQPPGYLVQLFVQADAEGKFVFPTVPPGEYRVILAQTGSANGESQSVMVIVHAGETTPVQLGGRGRPVTGRIVAAGADSPIDWKNARGTLKLKVPDVPQPDPRDVVAYPKWSQTEEAKQWGRAQHSYPVAIASDGSFRVDDIEVGTYVLTITLRILDPAQPIAPSKTYTLAKEFTVGEIPGGRSDNSMDLGTLTLQINKPAPK
jgi:beta-lactamase regulating signal transducer with metallopeptidase domain/protocatechuate 3,4-dioxygenase beta subunit